MLAWEILKCPECHEEREYQDYEVVGACEGNVFCPSCHCEIQEDTGLPALLCGKCEMCETMMVEGEFATIQEKRRLKRIKAALDKGDS